MEIYLVRHTTPDVEKGIFYGQTDLPVVATFEKEYNTLKPNLPKAIDVVYTSPLQRCAKLAHEISDVPVIDPQLKELNFGDWEMVGYKDIEQDTLNHWMNDFVNIPCPNGESFNDLHARVSEFWQKLLDSEDENIVVVSHSGVIRTILAIILGLPLQNCFRMELAYGSVCKVTYKQQMTKVDYINR